MFKNFEYQALRSPCNFYMRVLKLKLNYFIQGPKGLVVSSVCPASHPLTTDIGHSSTMTLYRKK